MVVVGPELIGLRAVGCGRSDNYVGDGCWVVGGWAQDVRAMMIENRSLKSFCREGELSLQSDVAARGRGQHWVFAVKHLPNARP